MNKYELAKKINELEGLTNDEKSELIKLLRSQKKYGLVWEDKPEDAEQRMVNEQPVLVEVPERAIISDDAEAPNHILIEGDNLEALTALSYTHAGKIDVIYIDPPYNTGNKDFIYNDSFVDKENGYRHSLWLSFMRKRLVLAKRLLKEKGFIFISIDDNEEAQLKLLCDEIFGEKNCRNVINTRRLDKNLSQQFIKKGIKSLAVGSEYILVYSVTEEANFYPIMRESSEERKDYGYWKGFWNAADRPTMRYELCGFKPMSGQWKWKKEKALEAVKNYDAFLKAQEENLTLTLEDYWKQTGKCLKFIRRRYENTKGKNMGVEHWVEPSEGILRTSNWTDIITTETALNMQLNFSSPKSIKLIKEVLRFSNESNDITILDFFAGSGTTLHATMQLNAEDGGHRQCILVTNNENGICENVTYERNRRVIQGYTTPKGEKVPGLTRNNLRYYKTKFVPRDKSPKNLRNLMALSTDMLCIHNDTYSEKPFAGKNINNKIARYFESNDGTKRMLVIYRAEAIQALVELMKREFKNAESKENGKLMVYVFSPNGYAYDDEFEDVADFVSLCAMPDAVQNAYRRVLPKKRQAQLLEDVAEETDSEARTVEESDLFQNQTYTMAASEIKDNREGGDE